MKKQLDSSYIQLTKVHFEVLTTIVAGTSAVDFYITKTNIFTTAGLWNVQRQAKSRIKRITIA